ncbi:Segregation and condensation protein B [Rubinisphaera italica]|uniref:Segregation and condensation protein B n=2 Tax=Rubinisphaera italica TaxID=2527969 RepID=A0A5C5XE60_9PLAN|nr:Segregation and condensation protein B [Rubinisphaera italica]
MTPAAIWQQGSRERERIARLYSRTTETTDSTSGLRTPQIARLEAVLFVADSPLSARKLVDAAKLVDANQCHDLVEQLNELYDADLSPFRIEQISSGYQLLTRPEYSQWLDRIHQRHVEMKLTPPALETLTIIAYRQPITRADVEAIRGVQSSEVIKQLMERQLIRIGGEDDSLGRPFLYETTKAFLQYMGIRRVDQLPNFAELRKGGELDPTVTDQKEDEVPEDESSSQAA